MLRPRVADVHRETHIVRSFVQLPGRWPFTPTVRESAAMAVSANLSWTLEPGVLIGVAIAGGAYVMRWRAVRTGNSPRPAADAPVWRLCCFLGALLGTLIALVSPIDALADQ